MKLIHRLLILIRNHYWYHTGRTLVNTRNFPRLITVRKFNGKQIRSNRNRQFDYSLDDLHWDLASNHPEYFL